jgi:hypothetical protein
MIRVYKARDLDGLTPWHRYILRDVFHCARVKFCHERCPFKCSGFGRKIIVVYVNVGWFKNHLRSGVVFEILKDVER